MVLTLTDLLYLLDQLGLLLALGFVGLLGLLLVNLGNLRLRFGLGNCLMSFRNSRVVGLSRGHFYLFVKTASLLVVGVLSVFVRGVRPSASHRFRSHTVAGTLDL